MNDDRDRAVEEQLRNALASSAAGVQPDGDGLMRIQQRIGTRRSRDRWLRPVAALGAVVVVAGAVVGGVAIARNNDGSTVTPADSPSPTTGIASAGFPAQGFFPFTSASEEADWETQFAQGHSPWIADPVAVATSWVPNYLKQTAVDQVVDKQQTATSADVTLGRDVADAGVQPVVVVHLTKFGKAWIVTGATSPNNQLAITSPAPGTRVDSPITVTGPGFGVDEVAKVQLRDAETPQLYAEASTPNFGNGTSAWSATLSFTHFDATRAGAAHPAVIVAMTDSAADGGVAQLTARKVLVGAQSPATSSGDGFYGVQGGVIERFDATGTPQGPVEGSDAYGTVTEVHRVGSTLYFTTRAHGCAANAIRAISVGGGAPSNDSGVATSSPGYQITGFTLSADETKVAYFQSGCGSHAGQGQLVTVDLASGHTHAVDFPSEPPVIEGDPVWESDGVHVDAFVRTGMEGYLARFDPATDNNAMPSDNACPDYTDVVHGLPNAITTAPDGTLWFATQNGTSVNVLSCTGSKPTLQLTADVHTTPTSLAVDAAGDVLVSDSDGKVWRAAAGGAAKELPAGGGVSSVTW